MKTCYFYNLIIDYNDDLYYKCTECNSSEFWYYSKREFVFLYYQDYLLTFNILHNKFSLSKKNKFYYEGMILLNYLPNISLQNIESKLNTMLAFN